jgi:hypothetical protein
MSLTLAKIAKEDIEFGITTFDRKGRAGTDITVTQVNISHLPTPYVEKTGTYTILLTDRRVFADTTSGAFTITLPKASTMKGEEIEIIRTDSSSNDLTVDGDGSETINGVANVLMSSQYSVLKIASDGANWIITYIRGLVG